MRTAILGKGMWIGRRPTVLTIGNYVKVKTGSLRAESGKKQSYHGRHDVDEIRKCESEDDH